MNWVQKLSLRTTDRRVPTLLLAAIGLSCSALLFAMGSRHNDVMRAAALGFIISASIGRIRLQALRQIIDERCEAVSLSTGRESLFVYRIVLSVLIALAFLAGVLHIFGSGPELG
jgi:hypothetical protein